MELKNPDTSVDKLLPAQSHYFKIQLGLEKKKTTKQNKTTEFYSTAITWLTKNTQYLYYLLHCGLKEEN